VGSFSIWHWLIVIIIVGILALIVKAITQSPRKVNPSGQPEGIGGWLVLLAIGVALAPLRTLGEIGKNADGYQQLSDVPNGPLVTNLEIGLLLTFAAFQFVMAFAFFKKKRVFPTLFMIQWVAAPVMLMVDGLLVSSLLQVPLGLVLTAEQLMPVLMAFVLGTVWVWYLYKSVRVRNTFTQ